MMFPYCSGRVYTSFTSPCSGTKRKADAWRRKEEQQYRRKRIDLFRPEICSACIYKFIDQNLVSYDCGKMDFI